MSDRIIIGSRESRLAVVQSEIVKGMIKKHNDIDVQILTMKTTGDIILNKTLDKIGGKGLFVKELDKALSLKKIDIAVHSLKDVPTVVHKDMPLIAFTERENPFDVLVLPKGVKEIDFSKPIGCSSQRRIIQLKEIYSKAFFEPIRGNVITRLEKLDSGKYSALVLAEAGLLRLGLGNRISRIFSADEIIPAAGQGIIVVQGRKEERYSYLKDINCLKSEICAVAERAFIRELDGGCSAPVAAFAEIFDDRIFLRGIFSDGKKAVKDNIWGDIKDAEKIGIILAKKIKAVI